ncbi:MAG TPA: hypothetical protein VE684_03530 [Crenalkalicoccus sp.]|jgi:ABC-type amino acid transport system permease subunit|nr:hypothetical protein [Crenalkalicoccus sp.]
MSTLPEVLSGGFVWDLLAGMLLNFEIAAAATVMGLGLGLVLAWASLGRGPTRRPAAWIVGLMRAAPTFVVMFFLVNAIPRDAAVLGVPLAPSGAMAVALSLAPYATAYVADNGAEALRQLRAGSPNAALLFLPNLMRAYFVMVMSSSAGAAIDVHEGISVILRAADSLPTLGDQLVVFAIGILMFGLCLQAGLALVHVLRRRLGRRVAEAPG